MREISLIQGSDEWKSWRLTKITATDISTILESNPWKSKQETWLEKVGLSKASEMTPSMKRGMDLEPIARKWYEDLKGEVFEPVVAEHSIITYLGASFDGFSIDRKRAIEIKCGEKSFKHAQDGYIPCYYMSQVQHQMLISGIDEIDYMAFNGTEGIIIPVKRDEDMIAMIIKECEIFWDCVQNFISPLNVYRDMVVCDE